MSAIGLQWGPSQGLRAAISTAHMGLGANTTILNTVLLDDAKASQDDDLSDEDIDRAIAEIQSAINKSKS